MKQITQYLFPLTLLIGIIAFTYAQRGGDQPTRVADTTYPVSVSREQLIEEAAQAGRPIPPEEYFEPQPDVLAEELAGENVPPASTEAGDTLSALGSRRDYAADPSAVQDRFDFDIEKTREQVIKLVESGVEYFKQNPLDEACSVFTHTKQFVQGDLYLFVYDSQGNVYAHGNDSHLLWKNLYDDTDSFNTPFVQNIIKRAKEGGGWVIYEWRNSPKVSYVQQIEKNNQTYIIGCGYYSHSKSDAVVNLVKGAVALFERGTEQGHPASWAFSRISYPIGSFVYGDLYLYALDTNGNIMAQGERPGLIGSNALDYQDEKGTFVNRKIMDELKRSDGRGVWVDYISKNAPKRAYAELVTDEEGKEYFIACGYYPETNRKQVVDLVRRGYQFMKMNGLSQSIDALQERQDNSFLYGDLYLFIYDTKGKLLAHGRNQDIVGQNRFDEQDQDGSYYVRNMIKEAEQGGGWINAKIKNSLESNYVEMVDLGIEKFVIGANFSPISKKEMMILLVESGVGYLSIKDRTKAFEAFINPKGKFVRGDLYLFVFDLTGICYAYGTMYNLIWRNMLNQSDENGRPFVKEFINTARNENAGTVEYRLNNERRVSYVRGVIKGDKQYIIGSGYYF